LLSTTAILTLSPGQLPPIQSWKRSNDFVKEFLGRDTRTVGLKVSELMANKCGMGAMYHI